MGTVLSTKTWVWCGGNQPCEERDGDNQVTQRFFAQGFQTLASPSSLAASFYYTKDHLGSIREVVDEGGNLRARYDYDAWGNRTKLSGDLEADFGFTGHLHHQGTSLILTHYRAYDPRLGRWLSRDPIAENGGINLYGYVGSNPVNWVDPLGLQLTPYPFPASPTWKTQLDFQIQINNEGRAKAEGLRDGLVIGSVVIMAPFAAGVAVETAPIIYAKGCEIVILGGAWVGANPEKAAALFEFTTSALDLDGLPPSGMPGLTGTAVNEFIVKPMKEAFGY